MKWINLVGFEAATPIGLPRKASGKFIFYILYFMFYIKLSLTNINY